MKKYVTIALLTIIFTACKDEPKEDLVNEVPKDGSIETTVKVDHLNDSMDVLTTQHIVHKNSTTIKTIVKTDTLPSLGTDMVKDDKDIPQVVKKDYNIYITVK
jgi:type III secretory pathway lipoprotein EscJ